MQKDNAKDKKYYDKKQQHEKERIQKETAADKVKSRCSICGKYTDRKTSPQCYGHGGGVGGGGGGGSDEKSDKKEGSSLAKSSVKGDTRNQTQANKDTKIVLSPLQSKSENRMKDHTKFNADIISEMLSRKLLLIDNDREKGMLTLKLQYTPALLPSEYKTELNKYVNSILNELDKFKKEHGISEKCYKLEKDNDENYLSLRVSLPNPGLYDAFIQQLANKFMLPLQNIEQQAQEKISYEQGENHFKPASLSTKFKPSSKKSMAEEESRNAQENKSDSIHPKSPLDGLKPKGWK